MATAEVSGAQAQLSGPDKVKAVSKAFIEYLANKGVFGAFADNRELWEEISVCH